MSLDSTLRELSGCGCCAGIAVRTPVRVFNRPGLTAIAYRAGTHSLFKQSLLARLSSLDHPALSGLTTRDDDDFTIGLLDAWSTVGDVLTFYQERIANEAYLRTATERLSVTEMARLIGYRLDPGVAASVLLAFEIESAPGAFGQALAAGNQVQAPLQSAPAVTIATGVKVQSIPGPDENPQFFETVEAIEAHSEHNAISPRLERPQLLSIDSSFAYLEGAALNVQAGDLVVIEGEGTAVTKPVTVVEIHNDRALTRLDFTKDKPDVPPFERPVDPVTGVDEFLGQLQTQAGEGAAPLDAGIVEFLMQFRWKTGDLNALLELQNWNRDQFIHNLRNQASQRDESPRLRVFRQRTKVFGFNAPKQVTYNGRTTPNPPDQWDEWDLETEDASPLSSDPEAANKLFLAEVNKRIVPGSYVAIQKGTGNPAVFVVDAVTVRPRTAYGISAETTELTLGASWWDPATEDFGVIRRSTVYAESELLELAPLPITDEIKTETVQVEESEDEATVTAITLDKAYLNLKKGQSVILTGKRTDLEGVATSEVNTLKEVWIERGFTVLELEDALEGTYERETVRIHANVALATHGESVREILGSGDASRAFQSFRLKQPPLTHVSASTASGSQSTLEVRVNEVLWNEVPSFYDQSPVDRVYVTRLDDDGIVTVVFGDGVKGARLPTGQANVTARYRKGIGLGGLVKAGQVSQLMTRPLGVKSAVNPLPSEGAEDPDSLEQARRNAPITILTLDRIVSLRDYDDFSRAFAGIDKALATWVWKGESRAAFLTIAGPDGAEVHDDSETYANLVESLSLHGDPNVLLEVHSYRKRLFRVSGTVGLEPGRLVEDVEPRVEEKLRERFSFDAREFGQPVALSEVIAAIHEVEGVKWVDIDALHPSDEPAQPHAVLAAAFPGAGAEELLPAELLTLDPAPLDLEVTL
ncbi:MAG TPA: putative baseplate assembly protein [Verrucomicrobiales bacterium]|nr:putative baseplate assembly protein [Verrucomicrobiales bacterium]